MWCWDYHVLGAAACSHVVQRALGAIAKLSKHVELLGVGLQIIPLQLGFNLQGT